MPSWWRHRWHLKVLALALAVAIWMAVTGEGRGVQDFRVPVDVALGTGATLSGSPPTNVTVRLRGPDSLLRRVDPYDLTIRVDLRDAVAGDRTVQLTPRNVAGVPADVEVALIDPAIRELSCEWNPLRVAMRRVIVGAEKSSIWLSY